MEAPEPCEKIARLFKAMAHPTRLRIVQLLARDVSCVDDMRESLGLKQPNISQHLAVMRGAQLVTFRRTGNRVCYGLADENLPIVVAILGSCGAPDLRGDKKLEKLLGDLRAHFAKIRENGPQ